MSAEDLSLSASANSVQQITPSQSTTATLPQYSVPSSVNPSGSKYQQLLNVIEDLGKDIRPTYIGNKICSERLKREIIQARLLVRDCLFETSSKPSS